MRGLSQREFYLLLIGSGLLIAIVHYFIFDGPNQKTLTQLNQSTTVLQRSVDKLNQSIETTERTPVPPVSRERLIFLLVYNLIRRVMCIAARSQQMNVNRLSCADALAWLRFGDITVLGDIKINPSRPGRLEPRVRKRPKKRFPCMVVPRVQLKAQLRARHCDAS